MCQFYKEAIGNGVRFVDSCRICDDCGQRLSFTATAIYKGHGLVGDTLCDIFEFEDYFTCVNCGAAGIYFRVPCGDSLEEVAKREMSNVPTPTP